MRFRITSHTSPIPSSMRVMVPGSGVVETVPGVKVNVPLSSFTSGELVLMEASTGGDTPRLVLLIINKLLDANQVKESVASQPLGSVMSNV